MKITDIISKLPMKVKLNNNFTLDDSFDKGTIVFVKSCEIEDDFDGCYKVYVSALKEDMEYNTTIAEHKWYNTKTGEYELNIFEFNEDKIKPNGCFEDTIYVMENDDCFDIVEDNTTLTFDKESAEALCRIFAGLSRNCYENAEVNDSAIPTMKLVYDRIREYSKANNINLRG